jgi:hypothetical protein
MRSAPAPATLGVLSALLMLSAALAARAETAPVAHPVAGKARLGINLSGPCDWNTELPFADVFRFSRPWISQRQGGEWGKGPALALDARGWVTRLEKDCWAETPLCTIEGGHYPAGQYTVLYEGRGTLEPWGAAKLVSSKPGEMVLSVDSTKGGFWIRIKETDSADYVRNIRVFMPGNVQKYMVSPFAWNPTFLDRWQGVACVRFMDWMNTNGSKQAKWSDRPVPNDATYSEKGVPLEVMIELANVLKADPWFCMPHLADDDYVRQFATMVKAKLDPKLKVYVEYSNEVWNGQFEQNRYAGEQGIRMGLAAKDKPWEGAWRFTAVRSVQIFKIWEEVFGGHERLVRVLPTQAANPYVSQQILGTQDAWKHADALAIAPYMGLSVPADGDGLTARKVETWTVDQALDQLEKSSLPEAIGFMKEQKKVADQFGLKLIAYEGGQHMVGIQGGENNEKMTALFMAANAHPRMGQIYTKYLAAWTQEGGDVFAHFSSVSAWSKWGSWGALQYANDDPAKSPKYAAIMRWAAACGQPVKAPR